MALGLEVDGVLQDLLHNLDHRQEDGGVSLSVVAGVHDGHHISDHDLVINDNGFLRDLA